MSFFVDEDTWHVHDGPVTDTQADLPVAVSASQIKAHKRCQRRRAWRKVCGLEEPEKPSAALGTETHEALERHILSGEQLTHRVALKGVHLLAPYITPPAKVLGVEAAFDFPYADGISLTGRIDLVTRRNGRLYVLDHKTSSSPKRYGLDEKRLAKDPQAAVYWAAARSTWPGFDTRVVFVYYPTRGRTGAYEVEATPVPVSTFDREIREIADIQRRSHGLDSGEKRRLVMSLPANFAACEDYGGCAYKTQCGVKAPFRAVFEQSKIHREGATPSDNKGPTMDIDDILGDIDNNMGEGKAEDKAEDKAEGKAEDKAEDLDKLLGIDINPPAEKAAEKAVEKKPAEKKPAEKPSKGAEGIAYYERCRPVDVPPNTRYVWELLEQANKMVSAAKDVPHWKCVQYGEGEGLLCDAVARILAEHYRTVGPFVVIDLGHSTQAAAIRTVLRAAATTHIVSV